MKKILLCGLFLFLGFTQNANATLIGDQVIAKHLFPDFATVLFSTPYFTVTGNASDKNLIYERYNLNMGAEGFSVQFVTGGEWMGYDSNGLMVDFNGLMVDDLDDSSGNDLQKVFMSTNLSGWNDSRLRWDGDTVYLDFKGLTYSAESFLSVTFDFGTSNPVPEPATMLLFGFGLLGIAGVSRKKA